MDERNLTTYSLAKAADVPWQTVKNLFSENSNPTIATLEKICKGLGITMSQFFEEEKEVCIILTSEQQYLMNRWNVLSEKNKRIISDILDIMMQSESKD